MNEPRDPNAVRFDPAAGGDHVESYFLKANEPSGDRALWVKATIFASAREPGRPLAEGWAIAFDRRGGQNKHVAVKHVLPFSDALFGKEGLDVAWSLSGASEERMRMRPGETHGRIARREHAIRWDLRFEGEARPFIPFPHPAMYRGKFPKSKTLTPYPDLVFSGEVEVDGERWDLSGWRGMQGHNWGRGHADLYAWCHVNSWESEAELVVEALSGRVRVGPVLTPLVTIVCARFRGVTYTWNGPLEIARAHGDVGLRRYSFSAENRAARIEGSFEAETDDMVGLYYPNPDGPMTYCLNSKLARAHVRFEASGRPPVVVKSRAAALEIGTRDAEHGVRMYV
jgi:hypothetical protein